MWESESFSGGLLRADEWGRLEFGSFVVSSSGVAAESFRLLHLRVAIDSGPLSVGSLELVEQSENENGGVIGETPGPERGGKEALLSFFDRVKGPELSVGVGWDDASPFFKSPMGRLRFPKAGRDSTGPVSTSMEMVLGLPPFRVAREVVTERDLVNVFGTFFELPAKNAGGIRKIRPVASHDFHIYDFCSFRGLLVLAGVTSKTGGETEHIVRERGGTGAGLWVGVLDDLWDLGAPSGVGGVWNSSQVTADTPSDPYLMTGYAEKHLILSLHKSAGAAAVDFHVEVDIDGEGLWVLFHRELEVRDGQERRIAFPLEFAAYWVRLKASTDYVASGIFIYDKL
uniref:Uncharacterized protein n=1 Tax=Chromera velia CCMP2878 TaxID=1169474 RepID=A0A0G4GPI6_9ALVE|eukprot:Cvel_22766.t1-p1 / transcript=Cvel_22766.t1 / gene=Cvel_22766 / organism=Chromera_velia_CCMP2878 / gene_product=hypothetical protein / transcript_product=hypothetical protein / location=Cvel_scaffold2274:30858-31880(-) / protein_length=341 / sequence_SO=supercontig / SO=protein_coding / is_pseudo=false